MKYEKAVYILGSILVLGGASMKVFDLPLAKYGNIIIMLSLLVVVLYQSWYVKELKNKLAESKS